MSNPELEKQIYDLVSTEFTKQSRELEMKFYEEISRREIEADKKTLDLAKKLKKLDSYQQELSSFKGRLQFFDEKISEFQKSSSSTTQEIQEVEIRQSNFESKTSKDFIKLEKLYMENLVVPNLIGDYTKFPTMKEFCVFLNKEANDSVIFREKALLEIKAVKDRYDQIMQTTQKMLVSQEKSIKHYVTTVNSNMDRNYNHQIELIEQKIKGLSIENYNSANELKDIGDKLQIEHDKLLKMKEETNLRLDEAVEEAKNYFFGVKDDFTSLQNEFDELKPKFNSLSDLIKDVRFKKNAGLDLSRREMMSISNNVSFRGKSKKRTVLNADKEDVQSVIKNYIKKGERPESGKKKTVSAIRSIEIPAEQIQERRRSVADTVSKLPIIEKSRFVKDSISEYKAQNTSNMKDNSTDKVVEHTNPAENTIDVAENENIVIENTLESVENKKPTPSFRTSISRGFTLQGKELIGEVQKENRSSLQIEGSAFVEPSQPEGSAQLNIVKKVRRQEVEKPEKTIVVNRKAPTSRSEINQTIRKIRKNSAINDKSEEIVEQAHKESIRLSKRASLSDEINEIFDDDFEEKLKFSDILAKIEKNVVEEDKKEEEFDEILGLIAKEIAKERKIMVKEMSLVKKSVSKGLELLFEKIESIRLKLKVSLVNLAEELGKVEVGTGFNRNQRRVKTTQMEGGQVVLDVREAEESSGSGEILERRFVGETPEGRKKKGKLYTNTGTSWHKRDERRIEGLVINTQKNKPTRGKLNRIKKKKVTSQPNLASLLREDKRERIKQEILRPFNKAVERMELGIDLSEDFLDDN